VLKLKNKHVQILLKTIKMQKVTGTLLIFFTLVGCEKKSFDYRNKYIGEYDMTYSYTYWQMGGVTSETTIFYQGSVAY
jgi:hypothetical protein